MCHLISNFFGGVDVEINALLIAERQSVNYTGSVMTLLCLSRVGSVFFAVTSANKGNGHAECALESHIRRTWRRVMLTCFEKGTSSQLPFHPVLFILLFLSFLRSLHSIVTSSLAFLQRPLLLAIYARTEHVTDLTQDQRVFLCLCNSSILFSRGLHTTRRSHLI